MAQFEIQYGDLIDVYGHSVTSKEVTFVPARIQLHGTMFSFEHHFEDYPEIPCGIIPDHADVAFVRARIPRVFGYTPTHDEDVEKALICDGFIAVLPDGRSAVPFECTDVYGRTSLVFSSNGPIESVKSLIADAFWKLIVAEPDNLDDFQQSVCHPGAGVWMQYGCKNGDLYCDESDEP